ncbi:MAG: MarR family transcriptional regulator [Rhodanobacter sp.]
MARATRQVGKALSGTVRTESRPGWTFLSNHGHVLTCLATHPDAVVRDMADLIGITERAVLRILKELEEAAILSREREGRRSRYVIHGSARLRHPIESHCTVDDLTSLVQRKSAATARQRRSTKA